MQPGPWQKKGSHVFKGLTIVCQRLILRSKLDFGTSLRVLGNAQGVCLEKSNSNVQENSNYTGQDIWERIPGYGCA